jgi:hypothetical protein
MSSNCSGNCFICKSPFDASHIYYMNCKCPFGSPVCVKCKSMAGQRTYVGSNVCGHCSKKFIVNCRHAQPLKCLICSESGIIDYPLTDFHSMVQTWFSLRKNQSLVRRNEVVAMAKDWNMFSHFYYRNYCIFMMVNPWTKPKKQAFFQLWLLSQMNYPVVPCQMMKIHSNLWESYPHSPLNISREFNWRFRRFSWVRKLISRFTMLFESSYDAVQLFRQSYLQRYRCTKHRMMNNIIRYLMSQHAEIFALSI